MGQSAEKLWAVAAHLGSLLLTPLFALVTFLVFKDRSRYIGHHAHQAMWFFFSAWICGLVLRFVPFIGGFLTAVLGVVVLCMAAVAGINALAGHWYEYPVVGRFWRRALGTQA